MNITEMTSLDYVLIYMMILCISGLIILKVWQFTSNVMAALRDLKKEEKTLEIND